MAWRMDSLFLLFYTFSPLNFNKYKFPHFPLPFTLFISLSPVLYLHLISISQTLSLLPIHSLIYISPRGSLSISLWRKKFLPVIVRMDKKRLESNDGPLDVPDLSLIDPKVFLVERLLL